jgi:GT2 family glycosyltransferase
MLVNVILLNYERKQHTQRVKNVNFANAGFHFDFVEVEMKGISRAINYGISRSYQYDAIVTMANDILMPDNWLQRMVEAAYAIPNTGMCGIHCVEMIGERTYVQDIPIHKADAVFGNVLIPMKAIETIGKFNEVYDPYGMQDRDYSFRLQQTGHLNYYLGGLTSEHIGHDVGQDTPYRRMKDEGLMKCDKLWAEQTAMYQSTNNYTIL